MRKVLLLSATLLLLTGCFETEFKFKTTVKPNGSVIRETKIDGRGANRFVAPSGKGWEVKTFVTRGGQSILEDTYYHIHAVGRFKNASDTGSDYQFNSEKQFQDISDEERKNFIQLGIVEPFSENIYSKNFVQITKHRGIFKSVFDYQEVFQNRAVIQLLLNDIKKEVIREQSVMLPAAPKLPMTKPISVEPAEKAIPAANPVTGTNDEAVKNTKNDSTDKAAPSANSNAPVVSKTETAEKTDRGLKMDSSAPVPPVTIEGQLLASRVVEQVAEERMKKDVLARFKFHSEVSLPGKIVSSNAGSLAGNTAMWDFSMSEFNSNYSHYTLTARSEMIEWKTIVFLFILILVALFGLSFVRTIKPKGRSGRRAVKGS